MKLKILSRQSNLALVQVDELMSKVDIEWDLIKLDSYGDKNKDISLMNNNIPDIFTKELDEGIINGLADIALHSAKDLPYPLSKGLEVIALVPPFDQTDSLVSSNNLKLSDLPKNAVIGTSSDERKRQILERRDDLKIFSIRGTIEERIEQVDNGTVDALIVATCALKRLNLENRITEILDFDTHPLQGYLAVTAKSNSLDYKRVFKHLDISKDYGEVSLIGFGPGDPDLLTIKADKKLRDADIIYYDALINKESLNRYSGEKVFVGKRKGDHSVIQTDTNELLYRSAISGKKVARLKGGDPFIFGRGGEELEFLESRLVKVDVIPGITAAQGAAASLRVPLTKRGISRELSFHTGHRGELLAGDSTRVYYMGGTKLEEIRDDLIKKGVSRDSTVLIIENATLPNEWTIKTDLDNMHKKKPNLPALVVVGDVSKNYLKKEIILNTGLRDKDYGLNGKIVHHPLIEVIREDFSIDIDNFDTIIFTSITAVDHFCNKYDISKKKVISIGSSSSKRLLKYGIKPNYTSSKPDSDTLYSEIHKKELGKLLYPCSSKSNNKLHSLKNLTPLAIYTTISKKVNKIDLARVNGIIFTSPSTVDSFIENYKTIPDLNLYCFGKFTLSRIKEYKETASVQTI